MNVSDLDLIQFSGVERQYLERNGWELERRGQAQLSVSGQDPLMMYKAQGRQENAVRFVLASPRGMIDSASVRAQTTTRHRADLNLLSSLLKKHKLS